MDFKEKVIYSSMLKVLGLSESDLPIDELLLYCHDNVFDFISFQNDHPEFFKNS